MTCPRAGKLIGGCKFSPRYDRIAPSADQLRALKFQLSCDIEGATTIRYAGDVCQRCGNTVERDSQAAARDAAGDGISHNPAAGAA